jgi:xylan 1,4-beta-xylosidase
MGSPRQPTPDQYAELIRCGQLGLLESPHWLRADEGKMTLHVSLPRQAVSLLRLELHDDTGR